MFHSRKWLQMFLLFILVIFQMAGFGTATHAATLNNAVTLSVVDQNGQSILDEPMQAVSIKPGESTLDLLKRVLGDQLKTEDNPQYGAFITEINGVKPSGNDYWGFFINGIPATEGISSYKVQPGDDLLFKIVSWPNKMVKATVSIEGQGVDNRYQNRQVEVIDGANAYDAIRQAFPESKINAPIDDKYFAYIANIDDLLQNGQYFTVYFNDKVADIGVSAYKIKDGDKIRLVVPGEAAGGAGDAGDGNNGKATSGDHATSTSKPSVSLNHLNKVIAGVSQYILNNGVDDAFEAVGLRAAGQPVPKSYINALAKEIGENNGEYRNVTDYEKAVLGVTAAGGNATNFVGFNLVKRIYNNERMLNQGLNGPIYALIAYDSGHYKVPKTAKWTREKLVQYIVDHQLKDGSWALFGTSGSPDMTGMALAALAPYQSDPKVKTAIKHAVDWLSEKQNHAGGFGVATNGGDSSESTAQVIIGLASAGINPDSEAFTKPDGNLLTHLLSFQQKDGGFSHLLSDGKSNGMASAQALMALAAYKNYLKTHDGGLTFDNTGRTIHPNVSGANNALPNTAGNHYNWMAFGLFAIIIGAILLIWQQKRRA